jgi:hypothetical protein
MVLRGAIIFNIICLFMLISLASSRVELNGASICDFDVAFLRTEFYVLYSKCSAKGSAFWFDLPSRSVSCLSFR